MWGFNFDIIYLFLNFFMLLVFYNAGKKICNGGQYWPNVIGCIAIFTFVLGFRYMRGIDYSHYIDVYNHNLEETQWFYTWLCNAMKLIGLSAYGSFVVYAFVFVICLFVFLKRYRDYAKWFFPMALIFLLYFHEFMIRQAFGFSIVFLYMNRLFDIRISNIKLSEIFSKVNMKSWLWCLAYTILAIGIHSGNIFVIILVTLCYLFWNRMIPLYVSLPALVFATYFFKDWFHLDSLAPYLQIIGGLDNKFSNYVNHDYIWFGSEGMDDIYTRNPIVGFAEMMGNAALFILGYKVLTEKHSSPDYVSLYNCFIFGTLFQLSFINLELMNRMGYVFRILMFIPLGLVLWYRKEYSININYKILYFCLLFLFYDYLKNMIYRAEMTKFLWDAPFNVSIFC